MSISRSFFAASIPFISGSSISINTISNFPLYPVSKDMASRKRSALISVLFCLPNVFRYSDRLFAAQSSSSTIATFIIFSLLRYVIRKTAQTFTVRILL